MPGPSEIEIRPLYEMADFDENLTPEVTETLGRTRERLGGEVTMTKDSDVEVLVTFLGRVPGIVGAIGKGRSDDGLWWVKFEIDIDHPLAWNVVQELGCVLNYLSANERLPTVFKPVSPAPYLNGGPRDFLSWVIESTSMDFFSVGCHPMAGGPASTAGRRSVPVVGFRGLTGRIRRFASVYCPLVTSAAQRVSM